MRRVALGLTAVAVAAVGVMLLVWQRGAGISAVHRTPWPLEATIARAAWRFLVPGDVRNAPNPVQASADVLRSARDHWADHCASCHANDGSGDTQIGRRTYPRVPDLRDPRTQQLTDGELFYAIEQGVPWTAMPGWTTGTDEGAKESWALVHFIRRLRSLSPDDLREMERLNPRPPVNDEREKAIDEFLNGPPAK